MKKGKPIIYGTKEADKLFNSLRKIGEIIEQDKEAFRKEFEKYFPTMEAYLKSRGMITPTTPEEMYEMFISDKPLERKDFLKFHNIIVEKELKEDEIRPPIPDIEEWARSRMKELKEQGYSQNKAAKKIEKEIGGYRSASAIVKWCNPTYK